MARGGGGAGDSEWGWSAVAVAAVVVTRLGCKTDVNVQHCVH